jgi:hypothetical protein
MTGTLDKTIGAFHDSSQARIRKIGGYAGPASYVTGGDPITAADLGMARIEVMFFTPATNGTAYYTPVWMPSGGGGAIRWLTGTTGVEAPALTNLSTYLARFEAIGK